MYLPPSIFSRDLDELKINHQLADYGGSRHASSTGLYKIRLLVIHVNAVCRATVQGKYLRTL